LFDFANSPTVGQQQIGPSGAVYQYDGTKWVAVAAQVAVPSQGNVGRNFIHNPMFNVQQRGTGPWTTPASYTVDRWIMSFAGGTFAVGPGAINDSGRAQIGDEAAAQSVSCNVTGGSGATDEAYFEQRIENVRRTAGKTVTLSFWAAAASGTPKLGLMLYQIFGTGGSPSAAALVPGQAVTVSTTWTRYSLTFTMPSVSGKTFGTNAGSDYVGMRFGLSAGSTLSPNYGGIGVQTTNILLWGIQLEIAAPGQTQPTPLERIEYADDLRHCMRFFETSFSATPGAWGYNNGEGMGGAHPAAQFRYYAPFKVTKRASPTITTYDRNGSVGYCSWYGSALNDGGTLTFTAASRTGFYAGHNIATSIETQFGYTASADL
jgi:hypothetical protein